MKVPRGPPSRVPAIEELSTTTKDKTTTSTRLAEFAFIAVGNFRKPSQASDSSLKVKVRASDAAEKTPLLPGKALTTYTPG